MPDIRNKSVTHQLPNKVDFTEIDSEDVIYYLVQCSLGLFSPLAAAAFGLVLPSPLSERINRWADTANRAIQSLEVEIKQLVYSEQFVSVVLTTSQVAIRQHHEEKLDALAAAVRNTAVGISIDEALQLRFIHFIDELSPAHLALMRDATRIDEQIGYFSSMKQFCRWFQSRTSIEITDDHFMMLVEDLKSRALIRISNELEDFNDVSRSHLLATEKQEHGPNIRVTEVGYSFVNYISLESVKSSAG